MPATSQLRREGLRAGPFATGWDSDLTPGAPGAAAEGSPPAVLTAVSFGRRFFDLRLIQVCLKLFYSALPGAPANFQCHGRFFTALP